MFILLMNTDVNILILKDASKFHTKQENKSLKYLHLKQHQKFRAKTVPSKFKLKNYCQFLIIAIIIESQKKY